MIENVSGIYLITIETDYGRDYYYVGQSSKCKKRFICHKSKLETNTHANRKMQSVFNKYKNLKVELLEVAPINELTTLEQWWIDETYGYSYSMNLAKDAEVPGRGLKMTQEAKIKQKLSWENQSENFKKESSLRRSISGKKRAPFSEETKKKMSEAALLRSPPSKEAIENSANNRRGKKLSAETCKKMSESRSGDKNWAFGKVWTEEERKKMSEIKKGCKNPHKGNVPSTWSPSRRAAFERSTYRKKQNG